jgi:hypothetical protein
MIGLLCFVLAVLASPFKSKLRLEAENVVLRHQLIVLRRRLHGRVRLTNHDRWFFIQLYRWFPSILKVLTIIRPETLVRWHRAGFRCHWRWKSRPRGGRPQIDTELRELIRRMSHASMANCSSSGLRSRSRASPNTWSNDGGHPARDGEPSCATTRQTLPPWSLFQLSVSTCFIAPHDPQARTKASSLVARPRTSSVSGLAIEPVTLIDPPAARTANSGSPSVTAARSSVPAVI